jgi:hypothetical protein
VTTAGVITGALLGCVLLIWVVNLIRNGRLYVGYGVIFVFGTLAAIAVLLVPPVLAAVTAASAALVPAPSLSIGAIVIMLFLLVYVFTQITILSNARDAPDAGTGDPASRAAAGPPAQPGAWRTTLNHGTDEALRILYETIDVVNQQLAAGEAAAESPETVIVGVRIARLTRIVNFIVTLEEKAGELAGASRPAARRGDARRPSGPPCDPVDRRPAHLAAMRAG